MKWGIIAGVGLLVAWLLARKMLGATKYPAVYGPPPPAPPNPALAKNSPPPPSIKQTVAGALGIPGAKYIDTYDRAVTSVVSKVPGGGVIYAVANPIDAAAKAPSTVVNTAKKVWSWL